MNILPFTPSGCIYLSVFALSLAFTPQSARAENEPDEQSSNQAVTTQFELSFELESLGDLTGITGMGLPPVGPVTLTTSITVTKQGYTLSDIRFSAGKSDLAGDVSVSYTGERPALTAKLHSDRIDLAELYLDKEKKEADMGQADNNGNKEPEVEKIFSNNPLPFDFIRNMDMDLSYSAKTIFSNHIELDNFEFHAIQENGNLDIHTLRADVANGKLVASGSINAANAPPLVSMKMDINKLEPGQLPDIKALNAIEGVVTDITLETSGSGNSVADIMGTLNGNFLSKSGKGINFVKQINSLDINFLTEMLNLLNPFRKKEKEAQIKCIVARFEIQDGQAMSDRGIAAQTQNLNIIGGGILDFKSEQFDLILHPETRSGINIGSLSLVDAVRLSGRFSDELPTITSTLPGITAAGIVSS